MTHFDDLAPCDYFGDEHIGVLHAIGWLTDSESFETGLTTAEVFARLKALLNDPWQPMVSAGVHNCELCQYDPPHGHLNLFVPDGTRILVCPELITHYIAAHHYRPPDVFLEAVLNCPDTRTIEYKKMLLRCGGRALVQRKA